MLVLVKANIAAVGLGSRKSALQKLPIRISYIETGLEAGRSLKNENVNSIISRWNLPDGPDGQFLRSLRSAKPYMPIIAIVDSGDAKQEIAARSIGVTAVLNSDVTDEVFKQVVCEVLGLGDVGAIEEFCAIADDLKNRRV